ncbi:hypothetical protein GQ44DRAFT_703467 [Phaeosphaeriaceae sp. PMI808]|nr:hypothetical protein GQ44DRAFT_703467 [Phaeosphaeriaceae sp. PMI808]
MVLNYKGIDYKTEWTEFPDVKPKMQSFGLAPNDPNSPGYFTDYSIPTIKYADGTRQMDSWPIAHELEKRYPTPSLRLDDPIVVRVRDHMLLFLRPLMPFWLPNVPLLLNKRSADFFYESRERAFGMSVQEYERISANEACWEKVVGPAKEVGNWLRNNEGPFFLGETVSYADFIFVASLQFFKRVDENVYKRFLALDPAFPKVYDACKQWLEKED